MTPAHLNTIIAVTPSARGCEDCLKMGSAWLHLRLCRSCGYVGCCDQSLRAHATEHHRQTGHPIIEGYGPPEGWGWRYVTETFIKTPDQLAQRRAIPRFD